MPDWIKSKYPTLVQNPHFQRMLLNYRRHVGNGRLSDVPVGARVQAQQAAAAANMKAVSSTSLLLPAAIPGNTWTNVGPAPETGGQIGKTLGTRSMSGRVTAIAVDPTNNSHWYIATAGGGVWTTTNAGSSWTPLTDGQATLSMGSLAIPSGNSSIIYAGTGEANNGADNFLGQGLLKSANGGATWTLLGTSVFSNNSIAALVTSSDGSTVLAGTNLAGSGFMASFPTSVPTPGVYRSTDGGNNWTRTLSGEVSALAADPTSFTNQYAALGGAFGQPSGFPNGNGLYRSADGGGTWAPIAGPWGTGSSVGRIAIAIAPSNRNTMYVAVQNAGSGSAFGNLLGLWVTTNAFATTPTFTSINVAGTDDGTGTHGFCAYDAAFQSVSAQCWYDVVLAVDPASPSTLYAGGIPLWKLTSNGTWTEVSHTSSNVSNGMHVDQHALAFAGTTLIAGNDGGVWSSPDGGATWNDNNSNLATLQPYYGAVNPGSGGFLMTAGFQDNGSAMTTSNTLGGWGLVSGGDGSGTAIATRLNFAVSFQSSAIFKTTTGGNSLSAFSLANTGIVDNDGFIGDNIVKCPANDDVLLTGNTSLWKSTNFFSGNATWANAFSFQGVTTTGNRIRAIAFAPSDTTCRTYAWGDDAGFLFITQNGGTSWTEIDSPLPCRGVTGLAFDPTNANVLYATFQAYNATAVQGCPTVSGHVFKTTNALTSGTISYTNISPPGADVPFDSIVIDPGGPIYVGSDFGIWKSIDGGSNWTQMGPAAGLPNVPVFDLKIGNGSLVAFTHGRGAFMLTSGAAGTPNLTISKTHTGNFTAGGTGSYTITVGNNGTAATSGTVTVADTLPIGLSLASMSSTSGWVCNGASCTNSNALAAGQSFPPITVSVNVAANAPASVTNSATASGGGSANATANDPTTIGTAGAPNLTISKTHTGNFTAGGTGSYTITVANNGGASTTSTVTVSDTLPSGLTLGSMTSTSGWICAVNTCTNANTLAAGQSFPPITVSVNVSPTAPSSVTNSAQVSGGGAPNATANDPTTITSGSSGSCTVTPGSGGDTLVCAGTTTALGANDTVQWSSLGADGAAISNTFSANSTGARQVQGAFASANTGLVSIVCPSSPSCSWGPASGGMTGGDSLIWAFNPTAGGNGAGSGPVTLTLPSNTSGVGAVVQADLAVAPGTPSGAFTVKLEVFNGATSLGFVTQQSNSNGDAFFLGVLDQSGAHITKAVFSLTQVPAGADIADFAIDKLSLNAGASSGNPVPSITSLSPSSTTAGGTAFTLVVNGSGFISGSQGLWNGANRTTTFVTANQVQMAITAADIATAGNATVTVFNPAPGGGTSGGVGFSITQGNNPVPSISSLSPATAVAGGVAFTLTVNGSNFIGGSQGQWNGSNRTTTFVTANQVQMSITAADIATAGNATVTVFNPAPGGGTSGGVGFSITQGNNPVPSISSLSPSTAVAGGVAFTLTVNGSNFIGGSQGQWNGSNRTTTFVNSNQIQMAITAADIATAGNATVTVFNPAPGGGTSGGVGFSITQGNNPVPSISTLSPATATAGGVAFTLTVNGSNFIGGSVVRWNGSNRTTTFVNAGQVQASIPATDIVSAGTVTVTVFNPAPGGGTSGNATFTINAGQTGGVTLTLGNGSAAPGAQVTVPVTINSTGTLPAGFQMDLFFDSTKLSFVSATAGASLSAASKTLTSQAQSSSDVRLLASGFNTNTIANGTVANVTFALASGFTAGGTTQVTLPALQCISTDANGVTLNTSCVAGTITSGNRCDLNGDGNVNVGDVQSIINMALGTTAVSPGADLNHDGSVNVADVQIMINVVLGTTTCPN